MIKSTSDSPPSPMPKTSSVKTNIHLYLGLHRFETTFSEKLSKVQHLHGTTRINLGMNYIIITFSLQHLSSYEKAKLTNMGAKFVARREKMCQTLMAENLAYSLALSTLLPNTIQLYWPLRVLLRLVAVRESLTMTAAHSFAFCIFRVPKSSEDSTALRESPKQSRLRPVQ